MVRYLLTWARWQKREDGQDMAEYALLISLISVALVLILAALRSGINEVLQRVNDVLVNQTI